jgi:hypothetical protein
LDSALPSQKLLLVSIFVVLSLLLAYRSTAEDALLLTLNGGTTITGELLMIETFDSIDSWEHYSNNPGTQLGVENGVYRAYTDANGYVWGLNQHEHSNVILEVQVAPLSIYNAFGIMCRADSSRNGNGYYFLINPGGYFSIYKGQADQLLPVIDWTFSSAIHTGIDTNRLRVVCMDETVAFYANDTLLIEAQDDAYASGNTGLVIGAAAHDADFIFDDLTIYQAQVVPNA